MALYDFVIHIYKLCVILADVGEFNNLMQQLKNLFFEQ
jgi:hypothetical protein